MESYTVIISWVSGFHRPNLVRHRKAYRDIRANSTQEAAATALSYHKNEPTAKITSVWYNHPQPRT
jgi:hypothetical protein